MAATTLGAGILGFSDDAFSLIDGSIVTVTADSASGKLLGTTVGTLTEEDLLGGFNLTRSADGKGTVTVTTAHRDGNGSLLSMASTRMSAGQQ